MTRAQFAKEYEEVNGSRAFNHLVWKENRAYLCQTTWIPDCLLRAWYIEKVNTAVAVSQASAAARQFFTPEVDMSGYCIDNNCKGCDYPKWSEVVLGDCMKQSIPVTMPPAIKYCMEEEGNNPMLNKATTADSSVAINIPEGTSDEMKQREYLLGQLREMTYCWSDDTWMGKTVQALRAKYHINAPTTPMSTQELIDAFKNKRIEIDQKKVDQQTRYFKARKDGRYDDDDANYVDGIESRYYGLKFLDLPVPDHKGYDKAEAELMALVKTTERAIHIKSPEEGLKALMELESHTIN